MQKHGKSFYFASQIFGKEQMGNISLLYSLCRYIDDCADELEPEESKRELQKLQNAFDGKESDQRLSQMISRLQNLGVKPAYLSELMDGACFDANGGHIDTRKDLLIYCYKVAGVVGLMMNPLLGVINKEAAPHAVDLGVGMQLTNICRDVLEDAQNGRNYLPTNELKEAGLDIKDLAIKGTTPTPLKIIVKRYLNIADEYYESALKALGHIPLRARLAILIAGEVYRAIGQKIAHNNYEVLNGRTFLNTTEKLLVSAKAFIRIFTPSFWRGANSHESELHTELSGLPGIKERK